MNDKPDKTKMSERTLITIIITICATIMWLSIIALFIVVAIWG